MVSFSVSFFVRALPWIQFQTELGFAPSQLGSIMVFVWLVQFVHRRKE